MQKVKKSRSLLESKLEAVEANAAANAAAAASAGAVGLRESITSPDRKTASAATGTATDKKKGGAAHTEPARDAVMIGSGDTVSRAEYDREVSRLQARVNWYVENQSLISDLESKISAKDKLISQLQSQLEVKQRFAPIPLNGGAAGTAGAAGSNKSGARTVSGGGGGGGGSVPASAGAAGGGVVVSAAGIVAVDASGKPMSVTAMAAENDELRKTRTRDSKRIKQLEASVKQLQTELNRKDPNSIAALIRATKPTLAESDETQLLRDKIQHLETSLAARDGEYDKTMRALRQEHDKAKAGFENRIAKLQRM